MPVENERPARATAITAPAKPLAIVLFGSPGSGKGTQSKYLVEWLGIPQISTGDMLRDHIRKADSIGLSVADRMKAGSLVADELVNELVRQRVAEPDCDNGFILDGYPRTPAQAEELLRLVAERGAEEVVIHLVVDYNVIISRMTGRRVCPKCGTLYNSVSRPPKIEGICDLDGTPLVVRDDDRGNEPERRNENDVDLRVSKEPEDVLVEEGISAFGRVHEVSRNGSVGK